MPQPINYGINAQDPTQSMSNAVGLAANLTQLKSAQMAQTQAEAGIKQQQRLNNDLAAIHANPTPAAIAQLSIKYPQLSEQFKRSYDMLGAEQQKSKVNMASQAYAALLAGDSDTAASLLNGYADAYRNSGMTQDADAASRLAELVKAHPETAKTTAGLYLSAAMGPEKFTENFSKLEAERRERDLEPSTLTKSQADARAAATKADFAESEAVTDLQKKGWDIYKIQEDVKIARENNRIAAMKAAADKETNDLKRQELQDKLKDAQMARDQTVRDRTASVEQSRGVIDNQLNTIDRVLKNPQLNNVVGSMEGSSLYPHLLSDEAQNAIADIDTIKSQTFLSQLQALKNSSPTGASGLGALNKEEGEQLMNGIQNLSRKQGEEQFRANAAEIQRLLLKARKGLTVKFGVPDTIPDTPNAKATPDEVDALVKKYGGG
jgi:hypothetical protein